MGMRRMTACLAAAAALALAMGPARANPALPMSIADLLVPPPAVVAFVPEEAPLLRAIAAMGPLFAGLVAPAAPGYPARRPRRLARRAAPIAARPVDVSYGR